MVEVSQVSKLDLEKQISKSLDFYYKLHYEDVSYWFLMIANYVYYEFTQTDFYSRNMIFENHCIDAEVYDLRKELEDLGIYKVMITEQYEMCFVHLVAKPDILYHTLGEFKGAVKRVYEMYINLYGEDNIRQISSNLLIDFTLDYDNTKFNFSVWTLLASQYFNTCDRVSFTGFKGLDVIPIGISDYQELISNGFDFSTFGNRKVMCIYEDAMDSKFQLYYLFDMDGLPDILSYYFYTETESIKDAQSLYLLFLLALEGKIKEKGDKLERPLYFYIEKGSIYAKFDRKWEEANLKDVLIRLSNMNVVFINEYRLGKIWV